MRATVQKCSRTRNGFLILAHAYPGKREVSATSDREHREGETVTIQAGRVVG